MGFLSIFDALLPMPKDGEQGPKGDNAQMYVLTITSAVLRVLPTSGGERLIEDFIAGKLEFVDGNTRTPVDLVARTDINIRLAFDNDTEAYYITGVDGYGERGSDGTWNDAGLFTDSAYGGDTIGKPKYIRVWVWCRDSDDSVITLAETTVPVIVEGEKGTNGDDAVSYSILTDVDHLRVVDEDVQIRILITTGKSAIDVGLHTAKETYGLTMTALLGGEDISHLVETSDDVDSQIYGFTPKLGQKLDMKLWKSNQLVARKTMYVTSDGILGKLIYLAGVYSDDTVYTSTTKSAPMVQLGSLYYYLEATTSVKGVNPATDVANKGGNWALMDTIKAQFIEILMADFAKLASAVFSGDYMFSQYGIDSDGNVSKDYQKLAEGTFTPNLLIDFLNGKMKCLDAEIKGKVYAEEGEFKGVLKGKLMHCSTILVESSEYYVDLINAPAYLYLYENPTGIKLFWLPDADLYEGVEIQVFLKRTYEVAVIENGVRVGAKYNSLYWSKNTYSIELGVTVQKYADTLSVLDSDDALLILPNILYRFKAMFGSWYVVEGMFTGE